MSLRAKTLSGVKWTTVSTIIVTLIQLLQLSILARFLAPTDFGLMAIVMVVIGFSQAFLDMGISNAIIHKQTITSEQLSTLYWLNIFAGFVLFFLVFVASPLVSIFYSEPELSKLIILVGLTFLIQPFGQQFMVLWQKEMRFAEMSKIDIATKLLSLVVSVVFAYLGYGVYALVYGTLAAVTLQTILFVSMGMKEHRPRRLFRWGDVHDFIGFGAYQMGERTVNYFNSQIDVILIGKLLGTEALGVYNIAKQLIMRPSQIANPVITKVTFPAMSKVQNDTATLKRVYLQTLNYLSSFNFWVYTMMIVLAPEIVFYLFGGKWMAAVPLVQILSLYGAVRSTGNPIGSLLLAKGKANLGFYWNLGLLFYIPVGIIFASHWGLIGVAWMLVVLQASLVIPVWFCLTKPLCDLKLGEYCKNIAIPFVIAIISGVLTNITLYFATNSILRLLVGIVVLSLFYFVISFKFNKMWLYSVVELLLLKKMKV